MNDNKRSSRIALVVAGVAVVGLLALGLAGAGTAFGQGMMGWGMYRGHGMGGYGMMGRGMGPGMMGPGWGRGYGPGTGPGTQPGPGGAPGAGPDYSNPVPRTQASIDAGRSDYETQCVACHGAEGRGDGPAAASLFPRPANLRALAGHRSDSSLFTTLTYGRGPMPAFGGSLTEHQRWAVVNYLQSLAQ